MIPEQYNKNRRAAREQYYAGEFSWEDSASYLFEKFDNNVRAHKRMEDPWYRWAVPRLASLPKRTSPPPPPKIKRVFPSWDLWINDKTRTMIFLKYNVESISKLLNPWGSWAGAKLKKLKTIKRLKNESKI